MKVPRSTLRSSAFEAKGRDLANLFTSSALALERIMVQTKDIKKTQIRNINLQAKDIDELLYKFLSDLVFLKDTYQLVFSGFELSVNPETISLSGKLKGEQIDRKRHRIGTNIKAVTRHRFQVLKTPVGWRARVELDI